MRARVSQLPSPSSATVEIREIAPWQFFFFFFQSNSKLMPLQSQTPRVLSSLEWPQEHKQSEPCAWCLDDRGPTSATQLCDLVILAKSLNLFPQLSNWDNGPFLAYFPWATVSWNHLWRQNGGSGAARISTCTLAANKRGGNTWLCHWRALWLWASARPLRAPVSSCKIGIILVPTSENHGEGWDNVCKMLSTVSDM